MLYLRVVICSTKHGAAEYTAQVSQQPPTHQGVGLPQLSQPPQQINNYISGSTGGSFYHEQQFSIQPSAELAAAPCLTAVKVSRLRAMHVHTAITYSPSESALLLPYTLSIDDGAVQCMPYNSAHP